MVLGRPGSQTHAIRIVARIQGAAGVLFAPTMTFHKQVGLRVTAFVLQHRD